jgi:hypothetical protein
MQVFELTFGVWQIIFFTPIFVVEFLQQKFNLNPLFETKTFAYF